MTKIRLRSLVVLLVSLGLTAGYAAAQGRGHGGGGPFGHDRDEWKNKDRDHDRDHDRARERRHDWERREHERWERAHQSRLHDHDRDRRPPGWDRGRKVGWGSCNVPPGQAKKYGCDRHGRYVRHSAYRRHHPPTARPVVVNRPPVPVTPRTVPPAPTTRTAPSPRPVWRRPGTTANQPQPVSTAQR